jgi:predicted PhzF superfamily epimerase YddE/YHI9
MPLFCADAFTDRALAGNPAAVCVLDGPADPSRMQRVAAELNLSETAFLVHRGGRDWDLRWFTPTVEVDLCGHATLASAHVLWTEGLAEGPLAFATASGTLTATREGDRVLLDFPAEPAEAAAAPPDLVRALGVAPVWTGRNRLDWLVEVSSAEEVRKAAPDVAALAAVDARGVILTAAGDGRADFVSRYFAPAAGIPEDPVTGSAHCALGPHWADRLGRDELTGHQVSPRGGVVAVRVAGNRVVLGGQAVTVWRGELDAGVWS